MCFSWQITKHTKRDLIYVSCFLEGALLIIPYQYFSAFSQKKYSTQHVLIAMIWIVRKIPDKGETFGTLNRSLSKGFNCRTLDLLKSKRHVLNFDMNAFNLTFNYLTTVWKMSNYGVFLCPYFPVFRLNTEIFLVNLHIQSKFVKIWTRKNFQN